MRGAKSAEAKLLQVSELQHVPCPPHLMLCERLVLLLRACCSLRKLPKMVAQGARAGGRKRRSAGSCCAVPQPPRRRLLHLAGTRVTDSSRGGQQAGAAPPGKGLQRRGTSEGANSGVLTRAAGSRALLSSLSLSLSHLSSGHAGDREGSQVPFRGRTVSRAGSPSHSHPGTAVTPGWLW